MVFEKSHFIGNIKSDWQLMTKRNIKKVEANMVTVTRAACVIFAVVALYCVAYVAVSAEARRNIHPELVSIVSGTLPDAKFFSHERQRAGEWRYDFTASDEDAFFDDENRATRQWREWQNYVRSMRAYRQQQEQEANAQNDEGAGAMKDGGGNEDNANRSHGADGQAIDLASYFTERRVQQRHLNRMKKQDAFNMSTADGVQKALSEVGRDVADLWYRLKSAGTSNTATDEAYMSLVERHFLHTCTARANGVDTTATGTKRNTTTAHFSLSLLHTPIVLAAEALPHVEKELQHLQELWQRLRHDSVKVSNNAELEAQLSAVADVVADSHAVCMRVVALADPLVDAAGSWVTATIAGVRDAITVNDESTEAKRAELKQLVKQQSGLQKAKQALERHSNVYKAVLRRHQLPTAEAMLFALELLAKQRLGDEVSGVMQALPVLSTTAPLTGLLESEWTTHVLRPLAVCLLASAAFVWLMEEVKEWCLRRVQAARVRHVGCGRSPCGGATSGSNRVRKLFLVACLLEALMPPLMPALGLGVHLCGAAEWFVGAVTLMRSSQRVVCAAALLVATVSSYLWGLLVRRLFRLIDPSVYRRLHAKTK